MLFKRRKNPPIPPSWEEALFNLTDVIIVVAAIALLGGVCCSIFGR